VVGRAAEHAAELHAPRARLERRHERAGLGDGRLVLSLGAELEQDLGVLDVLAELLEGLDGLLQPRPLAGELLRLLLVVPEAGDERLLAELLDFALQPGDVKDAPLAQQGAFGGLLGWCAFR